MSAAASLPQDPLERSLRDVVRAQGSAVVALSGGVDSSVIAALAAQELGAQALAVTGVSASLQPGELDDIVSLCARIGIGHQAVVTSELELPAYRRNNPDRCFHCKTELYERLAAVAEERGLRHVLDGTNASDLGGHRPGHAAARQRGVVSPLVLVGAQKEDVRRLAERLGLPNAQRPSSPCLSSRIAYGVEVTPERLDRVGRAEAWVRSLGFSDCRVRLHDGIARIEVPKREIGLALEHAAAMHETLRSFGFVYVTLDLGGLRSGSLLEILSSP